MLMEMQNQVMQEGKAEEELYAKFQCYCKTSRGELQSSIEEGEVRLPQVQNALEVAVQAKAQEDADIKEHKKNSAAAQEAINQAKELRKQESKEFESKSGSLKQNVGSLGKALEALKKGSASSFLQTEEADRLRGLVVDLDMESSTRNKVAAWLDHGQGDPAQMIGTLETMSGTMEQDLKAVKEKDRQQQKDYEGLVAAKTTEVEALKEATEAKLGSSGLLGMEIVELQEDLEDSKTKLAEDKKFAAELGKGCDAKETEWEATTKLRNEELVAIADTVKMLNDDDALGLFKKTLPSASFLQIQATASSTRRKALGVVHKAKSVAQASSRARLRLLAISLRHGSKSFDEVIKMVEEMTECLKREQESDDGKVKHCQESMDSGEKQRSSLQELHEAKQKAISDAENTIEMVDKQIEEINHGIQELDDNVNKATAVRKAENAEFKEIQQENKAALEILRMARNRMAKFYAPEEYVAGPVLLEQGPSNPTRGVPPPPPETFSAYKKRGDANKGLLQMMDTLMSDLDAKNSAMAAEEKEAQADYEAMMKEAKSKRTNDRKIATEKEAVKADTEATLQKIAVEDSDLQEELQATTSMLKDLHQECDWLLENHEVRKAARDGEIESLMKTKAILKGADFA